MDNYKNYRNLGEYDGVNVSDVSRIKDPIEYDDVELKQLTCSHIDKQKFIMRNGNEMVRCPACGLWDSGDTTL